MRPYINDQELATILAALRFYQEKGQGDPLNRSDAIHDIATADDVISLDDAGIDELCERLNGADIADMNSENQHELDNGA